MGQITVDGNTIFPKGYFVSKINPLFSYKPERIRDALEKMRAGYQGRGYYKARVEVVKTEFDEAKRVVNLWVQVKEHDKVKTRFLGNRTLHDETLRQILTFEREGDYDRYEVQKSREAILDLYRRYGFLNTTVEVKRDRHIPGLVILLFKIHEGVSTQVHSIRFENNQAIRSGKLKKRMKTVENGLFHWAPFRPEIFQKDLEQLPKIYRDNGYLEAKVESQTIRWTEDQKKVFLKVLVSEGGRSYLNGIHFRGNDFFSDKKLLKNLSLKRGNPFKPAALDEDLETLRILYQEKGFAYVTVTPIIIFHPKTKEIAVSYDIQEGPRVKVGRILFVGNNLTRDKALRKGMDIREGDFYRRSRVLESATSLRRLGSLTTVNIQTIGLESREEIVSLVVKVEEAKRNVIDLAVSFDTYERFAGEVTLTNRNLFGYAKRGNLRFKGGEKIQRGEANFINPRFFGQNMEVITTGFTQFEDNTSFNAVEVGGILSSLVPLRRDLTLLGRYEYTRTYITDDTPLDDATKRDNATSKVGTSVTYDTRDYFADPRNGIYALGSVDLADSLIGSGSSFLALKHWFGYYKTFQNSSFARRWTFVNSFRIEGLKNFEDQPIPIQERLFMGGDYTLRGFSQDSIGPLASGGVTPAGGEISLIHNLEIQFKISRSFKAVTFLDSGSLTNDFDEINRTTLRHSTGVGVRYITPVGPIRFDYGVKLDRQTGESRGRFHFTFGYPF
ncbi:MAG: outer membrane protein assembly factor BamA [bacterium]|nr:outer membrane protein assembly factor BamA [bacterium]